MRLNDHPYNTIHLIKIPETFLKKYKVKKQPSTTYDKTYIFYALFVICLKQW